MTTSYHKRLGPADAAAIQTRIRQNDEAQLGAAMRLGCIVHPCLAAAFVLLFPSELYRPLCIGSIGAWLIDIVFVLRRRERTPAAGIANVSIAIFTTLLSAYALALASRGDLASFWLLGAGTTCFQAGALMNSPWRGRGLLAAILWMALAPVTGIAWSPATAGWILVHVWAVGYFGFFRHDGDKKQHALFESEVRRIRAEADVLEARMKADLELAVEIHSSISTPERLDAGSLQVTSGHRSFGPLGGDWIAIRKLADGRLVLLVVDVVGKGVQAALVVHAIQSLWVRSEAQWTRTNERREEDPGLWLAEVNRVLFDLGAGKPHNATAGLAVVSSKDVAYWGAGHLALFVTGMRDGVPSTAALPASGPMLGIDREIVVSRRTFSFEPSTTYSVLLGSDGVFDGHVKPRELQRLAGEFGARGAAFLADLSSRDDRSLIMVERKAA